MDIKVKGSKRSVSKPSTTIPKEEKVKRKKMRYDEMR